jgi:hypothetical protein
MRGCDKEDGGSRPARTKKFTRPHLNRKMLDMMAFTSQSSYSWKHKIETSQSRPTWAESKTLCPKYQSRKVWRHGSRAGFLPSKHKILSSNPNTEKQIFMLKPHVSI